MVVYHHIVLFFFSLQTDTGMNSAQITQLINQTLDAIHDPLPQIDTALATLNKYVNEPNIEYRGVTECKKVLRTISVHMHNPQAERLFTTLLAFKDDVGKFLISMLFAQAVYVSKSHIERALVATSSVTMVAYALGAGMSMDEIDVLLGPDDDDEENEEDENNSNEEDEEGAEERDANVTNPNNKRHKIINSDGKYIQGACAFFRDAYTEDAKISAKDALKFADLHKHYPLWAKHHPEYPSAVSQRTLRDAINLNMNIDKMHGTAGRRYFRVHLKPEYAVTGASVATKGKVPAKRPNPVNGKRKASALQDALKHMVKEPEQPYLAHDQLYGRESVDESEEIGEDDDELASDDYESDSFVEKDTVPAPKKKRLIPAFIDSEAQERESDSDNDEEEEDNE